MVIICIYVSLVQSNAPGSVAALTWHACPGSPPGPTSWIREKRTDDSKRKMFFHGDEIQGVPDHWYDVDSLANYSLIFPFEASFNRRLANAWLRRNWSLSIWTSLVYIVLITVGERLMKHKKEPYRLRGCLCAWNLFLLAFSTLGFLRTTPELFRVLSDHGFVHSICQATYAQDQVFDFWIFAFLLSKFVELFDTAFIVLRRRSLTFLHCYHHVTVLVYCWHGGRELTAAGRWFCWMNYGVHSVMYTYYAFRAYGARVPRAISISVTSLQIVQMLIGCFIVCTVYKIKYAASTAEFESSSVLACHQSWSNLYFACAMYMSYFFLFLRYFFQAYIATPHLTKASKGKVEKELIANIDRKNNNYHMSHNGYDKEIIGTSYAEVNRRFQKRTLGTTNLV